MISTTPRESSNRSWDDWGAEGEFSLHADDFLHPGKSASVSVNGTVVGTLGEVHPLVVEAFELDGEVVVFFELDLNRFFEALPQARQSVKSLARFPASLRDISILVDRDIPAARVQRIIEGQPLVERTILFDVYEGEEAPPGKVSLAYRIQLRASNRTLSSRDVNRSLARVLFPAGKRSGSGLAEWYRRRPAHEGTRP